MLGLLVSGKSKDFAELYIIEILFKNYALITIRNCPRDSYHKTAVFKILNHVLVVLSIIKLK